MTKIVIVIFIFITKYAISVYVLKQYIYTNEHHYNNLMLNISADRNNTYASFN